MKPLLIICGATATGKTKLAVDCAKLLNSEIISADSQLVYRGLNIGTAKPTADEMEGINHHLIDVVPPDSDFSVADYRERALSIVERLQKEGKTPIICGGTGFYINSILYDFGYGNSAANDAVREKYYKIAEEKGKTYLFSLLEKVDPESAAVLHENDVKRVVRALEIFEVCGRKKSEQRDESKPRYDYLAVAIDYPRDELYKRIDMRVDKMFAQGLVEEVKSLLTANIDENCRSMQAIGYKEVIKGLKNGISDSIMRDIIKLNTRHYAKRQITFFKKMPNLKLLKPEEATAERVVEILNER